MRFEVSISLPAAPKEIWERIADLPQIVAWLDHSQPAAISSQPAETPEPSETSETPAATAAPGATLEAKMRIGPISVTDHVEVVEWQPPTEDEHGSIRLLHAGAIEGETSLTLEPTEDGTALRATRRLRLPWWLGAALGSPLVSRILSRSVRSGLRSLRVDLIEEKEPGADDEPGALIGRGQSTEVRRYGQHAVRISLRGDDLSHEANAMDHVAKHGFPAPALISQPDPSSIVMERLHGPTMLQEVTSKPWLLPRRAKALAELHHRLGAIEAPSSWPQVSAGDGVCHLDMHPDNVKVTEAGFVVIDWSNAARGDAAFDAALTYVTLRTTPYAAGTVARTMVAGFRRQFAQSFLRAFGYHDIMLHLRGAAELRLLDPNLLPAERESVFALARGELD